MTTPKDTDRSARAKRQGRKRHPDGTETFGENERTEASSVRLPTTDVGSMNVTTATDGLMALSSEDFNTLSNASSADVVAFLETTPSAPDLPGPDHPAINDIAKQIVATYGLADVDVEGCTGSWGDRKTGEGAVSYMATTWDLSVDNDYYKQPEPVNERELEGTMTFEEFKDGYLQDYDGGHISIVADIDFKRLSEEFGDDGGQSDYLEVLEYGAKNRADEVHQHDIEKAVKERLSDGVSPFASPSGRMELAAIIKQQRGDPHADANATGWAEETSRTIHNSNWQTHMGMRPKFDDLDVETKDKVMSSANLLADLVPDKLNRRAQRRETETVVQPESVIERPQDVDPLWREKIDVAKAASDLGRALREDKALGFSKFGWR